MTRDGKKPAEDVKRAFVRAIELAGLKVHGVRMFIGQGVPGRLVIAMAQAEGWTHESPALQIHTFVAFTGEVGLVEIRCTATEEDSRMNVFVAPILRDCSCRLENLPEILRAVWKERQVVISRVKRGERDSRFVGRWVWEPLGKLDLAL